MRGFLVQLPSVWTLMTSLLSRVSARLGAGVHGFFATDSFNRSRADRADNLGIGARHSSDAMGAGAGHGLWLRQGRQDVFLQDGHQQCRHVAEGREESAEGYAV